MKKLLLMGLFLVLISFQSFAQSAYSQFIKSAVLKMRQSDHEGAKKDLHMAKVEANKEEKQDIESLLALIEMSQGNYKAAEEKYLLIANDKEFSTSDRVRSYIGLGQLKRMQGDKEAERKIYKEALKLNLSNDFFDIYFIRSAISWTYSVEGKYDLARKELDEVLSIKGIDAYSRVAVWMDYAQTYFDEKKYEESREYFFKVLSVKEALSLQADQSNIRHDKQLASLMIAKSYFEEKNYTKSKEEYRKVLEIKNLTKQNGAEAMAQIKVIEDLEKADAQIQSPPK